MPFQLIDSDWQQVLDSARADHPISLRLVSPFIKLAAVHRLLSIGATSDVRVLTRFNLQDFYAGVSDPAALRLLLDHGARIRGVRNRHAKLYLFGDRLTVVTSANLTVSGLTRNHEFGFKSDEPTVVAACRTYFEDLWAKAGTDLTGQLLASWEEKVTLALSAGSIPVPPAGLGDEGTDMGEPPPPVELPAPAAEAAQWFVKFFGVSINRADRSMTVREELERSGSHWACTYPAGKRPRRVRDGAVLYPARMVKDPDDIVIYGRTVGLRHRDGIDEATDADIARRPWKSTWPIYVRVHHGRFLDGTLKNGVSLNELMATLGSNAFAVTKRHATRGRGNVEPRLAYRQQAAVELTPEAAAWVDARLEERFAQHGALTPTDMQGLDWPVPSQ